MRGRDATAAEVAAALLAPGARPVITSHHNPDADAIGSMLGLARALRAAGQDVTLAHADEPPVPGDLTFLLGPGEEILARPPADLDRRTYVAVDCASEKRMWSEEFHEVAATTVNIDHHKDNTRYGDLNHVLPDASSTAEVLMGVIAAAGIVLTPEIAAPLYAGMVTDTGRFGYTNTSPATHRAAAVLLETGIDHHELGRRLYEDQPRDRLALMGRALMRAEYRADGRFATAVLTDEDVADAGGEDTEGIVEMMRAGRGVAVAALVRAGGPPGAWRVSLRTTHPDVDVGAIAGAEGGGGHRAAAGFTTQSDPAELLDRIEGEVRARLGDATVR
ncbi:MAG: DHH family phosphoesterase [Miltoncostaeaceae bacterium]